jgi:hypothetical protein
MGDYSLPQMGDLFTGGACFDTNVEKALESVALAIRILCENQRREAYAP